MANKVRLSENHIEKLSKLPEQGMGYQIVDVMLDTGEVLYKRTVVNSEFLLLDEDETLSSGKISGVKLHK